MPLLIKAYPPQSAGSTIHHSRSLPSSSEFKARLRPSASSMGLAVMPRTMLPYLAGWVRSALTPWCRYGGVVKNWALYRSTMIDLTSLSIAMIFDYRWNEWRVNPMWRWFANMWMKMGQRWPRYFEYRVAGIRWAVQQLNTPKIPKAQLIGWGSHQSQKFNTTNHGR